MSKKDVWFWGVFANGPHDETMKLHERTTFPRTNRENNLWTSYAQYLNKRSS